MPASRLKRARRFVRYLLLRAIHFALGLLPLRWALALGRALGRLGFLLARGERNKALISLATAFPQRSPSERLELARRSFEHLAEVAAEMCCITQIDPVIERYVDFTECDRKLLADALAEGKGVLFASGHVGNFELLARRVAMQGFPSWTVAKKASDPRATAFIDRMRASGQTYTLWRGNQPVAPRVLEHLRQGHIVGLVIDQDTRVRGVFVDFFGKKAFTPRSIGDFALSTFAPVITGFIWRRPDGGHRIELTRVHVPRSGDAERDVVAIVQEVTRLTEEAVRREPHAYAWIHQRWRTRPPEETSQPDEASASSAAAGGGPLRR